MKRCAACHTLVQPQDPATSCPECVQDYHLPCWDELGGCATYGCPRAAQARKPSGPQPAVAGWGDAKACPACGASIGSGLLACLCGAEFPYADPMTRQEYGSWVEEQRSRRAARRLLVALFIVSLAGVVAPVTGSVAGWLAWRDRRRLEGADGTYLAMGYGAAALGATYALTFALLLTGL